jgi:hypothetical protein
LAQAGLRLWGKAANFHELRSRMAAIIAASLRDPGPPKFQRLPDK